ncbi:MAG TPA: site-specific DNA-methyltransferase [Clostridiales bacterium]|nr:site-specific DNA-methyltransferase [Clostridiales bacterium]
MQKKGKLELTWVGKYNEEKLEPRILVEDKTKSYGNPNTENMLIHGDNLIALKSLEQDFAGKIKCIYIDPPFNTGQAFENYDDNLEISIWLSLMRKRLEILRNLLSEDGTLFVHIDSENLGYLMVLLDEIFLRHNRLYTVTFKQGAATGHKAINPGCVTTTNFILMYAKDKSQWKPNKVYTAKKRDDRYGKFITNIQDDCRKWNIVTLTEAFASYKNTDIKTARKIIKESPEAIERFVIEHSDAVIRTARPDYESVGKEIKDKISESKAKSNEILYLNRDNNSDMYFINGERILFYKDKLKLIDGQLISGEPLTTLWDDILSNNLHNEGGVSFPKGKKPEYLIKRVLELATQEGDFVLDSFLGSGTTAAVAHKMKRKWIGIEMGEQCYTHCLFRLKEIVNGEQGGISQSVNWQGGGGFKFYELAESLLVKSKVLPIYQLNSNYTFDMVVEAICKIEGFKYSPYGEFHGYSSENRFIHVTSEFVNSKYIMSLMKSLGKNQSLLIYCTKMQSDMNIPDNVEVKKIPQALLEKCNFESEVEQ